MSMSIRVVELDRMIDQPHPPAALGRNQRRAWDKGFMRRCWRPHDRYSCDVANHYDRRHSASLRAAFEQGWQAAEAAIEAAKGQDHVSGDGALTC